jgi:hypothetical protein
MARDAHRLFTDDTHGLDRLVELRFI